MTSTSFNSVLKSPVSLILIIWLLVTLLNINKAYHIDDTFHLKAAECLQVNPLKPMSGLINWDNSPTPMYMHNQPPLFFYLIALTDYLFGNNEIVMHLLLSVFVLLSLVYFQKICAFINVKNEKLLIALFAFCPAFIVNQNLMTDIPILAICLASMYFLIKGLNTNNTLHLLFSVLLLSIGLLIKYSMLPLFFVLLISILCSNSYKKVYLLAIPILILVLWSMWNIYEFDAIHLINRPKSGIRIKKIMSFLGTIGSISFFTILFFTNYFPKRNLFIFYLGIVTLFSITGPLVYFGFISETLFSELINILFILNGLTLMLVALYQTIILIKKQHKTFFRSINFQLLLFIFGFSAFISFFAPFSATRHTLLIIPFLLLFGHHQLNLLPKKLSILILGTTLFIGSFLGVSDWLYADFYRSSITKVITPAIKGKRMWSAGHWGWQWYSEKAGMKIYNKENENLIKEGDIIVFPNDISIQEINPNIKLKTLYKVEDSPSILTFLSVKNYASMYNSSLSKPAWSLSKKPIDVISICEVEKGL